MARGLRAVVGAVFGLKSDQSADESTDSLLLADIEQARRQWIAALSYCDQVTDPTDIDFAIYHLKSAQQRYINLLQQAKRLGVRAWDLPFQEMVLRGLNYARRVNLPAPERADQEMMADE